MERARYASPPPAPALVLIQIKILQSREEASKEFKVAGFLRKGHLPAPLVGQNPERFGKNRESLYTSFPGTAGDSPHHECSQCVGYRVPEREPRFKSWVKHRGDPHTHPLQAGRLSQLRDCTSLSLGLGGSEKQPQARTGRPCGAGERQPGRADRPF